MNRKTALISLLLAAAAVFIYITLSPEEKSIKKAELLHFSAIDLQLSQSTRYQNLFIPIPVDQLQMQQLRYWKLKTYFLPAYNHTEITFDLFHGHQNGFITSHKLTDQQPLQPDQSTVTSPLWLYFEAADADAAIAANLWITPSFTAEMTVIARAEQQRREKMADKAYFFGYATNNGALE